MSTNVNTTQSYRAFNPDNADHVGLLKSATRQSMRKTIQTAGKEGGIDAAIDLMASAGIRVDRVDVYAVMDSSWQIRDNRLSGCSTNTKGLSLCLN